MKLALIIAHLVFSLVLIVVVLLQQSKQAGLSGAVGGGADTFFGKNKGRTVDAMLKKLTGVFAILFIVTSLSLAFVASIPEEEAEAQAPVVNVENEADAGAEVEADAETEAE